MSQRLKISACVNCRQMKLKCDSRSRFPEPCSRCTKHNLSCSIDPSFKRTAKRERMIAIERELKEIKAASSVSENSPKISRHHDNEFTIQGAAPSALSPGMTTISSQSPAVTLGENQHIFSTQLLDEIEISPQSIEYLIQSYYLHFHPHFPILPNSMSFIIAYNRCPLLFWTVIAVASKDYAQFSHLYVPLSLSVPRLATDLNVAANQSLETIQALLILCWWPFPFRATINDPAWTYCGLATHRALQFGLHRAQHNSDFRYDRNLDEEEVVAHQKTWLGCYITNQILSSHLGIPSTVQPDNTVMQALASRPSWLPCVLEQHLKIAYNSQQVCQTLGNDRMTSTGLHPGALSIIQMFEIQLRALEAQIRTDWSLFTQVAFWRNELQLCNFAFPGHSFIPPDGSGLNIGRLEILARGGISAMNLIQAATSSSNNLATWTNVVRMGVGYAVFYLLKLTASPDLHVVDPVAARNCISQAWTFLHRGSEMEDDHFNRVCSIIEYLSKNSGKARKDDLALIVQSRMGANLLWDSAWRAKARFSQTVKDSKPDDYTSAAAVENLLGLGLDFENGPPFLDLMESGWDFLF